MQTLNVNSAVGFTVKKRKLRREWRNRRALCYRMPPKLITCIRNRSRKEKITMTKLVQKAIEQYLKERDALSYSPEFE